MLEFLQNVKGWAIDIETAPREGGHKSDALHFKRNQITCVGFAWKENGQIQSVAYKMSPTLVEEFNQYAGSGKMVGHNIKFDAKTLQENGFKFNAEQLFFDTYIAAKLLNENLDSDLDSVATKYLGHGKIGTFDDQEHILEYCANDAKITLELAEKMKPLLEDQNLTKLFKLEMVVLQEFYKAEIHGMGLDTDYLTKLLIKYKRHVNRVTKLIYKYCGVEFNINSTQQLSELMYNKFAVPILKKTPAGKPSTDTRTLAKLVKMENINQLPRYILYYRHWEMLQRHIEKLLEEQVDGKIHCTFNTCGTETGRFSCSEPNLQQIPAKSKEGNAIRRGFIGCGKGIIICDYSNVELRLLAHFTRDPRLLAVYQKGGSGDLHQATADRLGVSRADAKTINFGISYGMGPQKLAESLNITEDAAKDMLEEWYKLYSFVNPWKKTIVLAMKNQGFVRSIYGRKRRIQYNALSYKETFKAEREAVNFVIQGSSADITKLAIQKLRGERILLQVHDELVLEKGNASVGEICRLLDSVGEELGCRVPIIAEGTDAYSWEEK